MIEPTIALVFSPEPWVERLHRHLADHGGARVRQIVLDPTLALEESYDALVVSHRWPGLTSRFVKAVQARGSAVLGVFDPAEPAGEAYLRELDVDRIVGADVPIADFVGAIVAVGGDAPAAADALRIPRRPIGDTRVARRGPLVVTGIPGSGAGEIALGLAVASAPRRRTVLVDAHEYGPSLATRLGVSLEPGLLAAVDAVEHGVGDLSGALVALSRGLDVIVGVPGTAAAAQLRSADVASVVEELDDRGVEVIVDVASSRDAPIGSHMTRVAGSLVFVAPATPLGVTRTLAWFGQAGVGVGADLGTGLGGGVVHIVFNRAPRERFRRAELEHEVCRTLTGCVVSFVPTDPRVDDAMWRGSVVGRGPFSAAVGRLGEALAGSGPPSQAPAAAPGRRPRRVA